MKDSYFWIKLIFGAMVWRNKFFGFQNAITLEILIGLKNCMKIITEVNLQESVKFLEKFG